MLTPEQGLAFDSATIQKHADKRLDDAWGSVLIAVVVGAPLDDNHDVHIANEADHQNELGHEHMPELYPVSLVDCIESFL